MLRRLEVSETNNPIFRIIREAHSSKTHFIIEHDKTPYVVMMGIEEYQQLCEDKEDIEAMMEAATAPKSEKIDYDEYRKNRVFSSSRLIGDRWIFL